MTYRQMRDLLNEMPDALLDRQAVMNVRHPEPDAHDLFNAYWVTLSQHALADDDRLPIFGADYPMLSINPSRLYEDADTADEADEYHGEPSTYRPWLPDNWQQGRWKEFGERFGLH